MSPQPAASTATCRVPGCACLAVQDALGFCGSCRDAYERRRAGVAARERVAVDLVRAAHPALFEALDRMRPGMGDALAGHLASYAESEEGAPTLSLPGLDDFLAAVSAEAPR